LTSPRLAETGFLYGEEEMATFAVETFFLIFALMSIALTIVAVLFVFKTTKLKSKKELQEKRMEIIDKHFNEMTRIECPYCKTLYDVNMQECPSCGASTKKILFPEIYS
jgi:hypothetical protein